MVYALFALSALSLFFFVRGISQHIPDEREIVEPVQIAGPRPIWCEKEGWCYEDYEHEGKCIPFGSFSASQSYADYVEGYPERTHNPLYVGKHIGAEEAKVHRFSGYTPRHGK